MSVCKCVKVCGRLTLSPISETMIREKDARKAGKNSPCPIEEVIGPGLGIIGALISAIFARR